MTGYTVTLIEVARLRPTEEVDAAHVETLRREIGAEGALRLPLLIERASLAILDGHHRWHAAKALGLARVPVIALAYDDPRLTLSSWTSRSFEPAEVLAAALSGRLLPRKSTRHILNPAPAPSPTPIAALAA